MPKKHLPSLFTACHHFTQLSSTFADTSFSPKKAKKSNPEGIPDSAFQSNLLSLISHELRTPLTGILNALTVLGAGGDSKDLPMPQEELISMASRNAKQLQNTLASLLDHAAIESGGLHASLREVSLRRIALRVFGDSMPVFSVRTLHPVFGNLPESPDHVKRAQLSSAEKIADFYARYGVGRAKFLATMTSFGVNTKVNRGNAIMRDVGVDSTPAIVVDGKFLLNIDRSSIPSFAQIGPLINFVVDLAAKERVKK